MSVKTYIIYGVSLSNKELVEDIFGDFKLKRDAFDDQICRAMAHRFVRMVNHVDFKYFRMEDVTTDKYINIFGFVTHAFETHYSAKVDMRFSQAYKMQFNRFMESANIPALINCGRYIVFTVSNDGYKSFVLSPRSIISRSIPHSPTNRETSYWIPQTRSHSKSPTKHVHSYPI